MVNSEAGKGDTPRRMQISRAEYELRTEAYYGNMTDKEFERRLRQIRDKNDNKKI